MLKNLLKKPTQHYDQILHIVQFGSSIQMGKEPNDIDIVVIYKTIPLKEQLDISQKIKEELQEQTAIPIHINSATYQTLFDQSNFAKESMLRGIDLETKYFFAKKIGFIPKIHIFYSLQKFEKKDKVRFNYFLHGRKNTHGYLTKEKGSLIKPGFISLNPIYEYEFFNAVEKSFSFEKKIVLEHIE